MKKINSLKITILALALLICCTIDTKAQTFEKFMIGNWMGNIEYQGNKIPLVIRVQYMEKDSSVAFMDSPSQGAKDITVSKLTLKNDSVFLGVKLLGVTFSGKLNTNDSTIKGIFHQSTFVFPLTLKKVEKLPELKRPQEPKPPFPYLTNEVTFRNEAAFVKLAGTLTLPNSVGKFPVVLLISGSGPQNRDEELLGHKPFLVLSDYLTRNGIAVLRYDDRGTGKSRGDFGSSTTFDFADDAEAAVRFLKTQANIDTNKIGIIGHSEGGMIAPILASRNKAISFIVLLAGPGLTGEQIIQKQSLLIAKINGESEKKITEKLNFNAKIYKIVNQEKVDSIAGNKIRKEYDDYLKTLPMDEKESIESQKELMIKQITSTWYRTFLSFDPKIYLTKTNCAVLALNGEKDLQVPADENLTAIEKYLKEAKNTNYTVKKLPNLNHLFQNCKTGSPVEYVKIEETISPDVMLMIKDWILKITK